MRISRPFFRSMRSWQTRSFATELNSQIHQASEVKTTLRTSEVTKLAEQILTLNMLEVVELQKVLAERVGLDLKQMQSAVASSSVSPNSAAAAPAATPAGAAAGGAGGAGAGATAAPAAAPAAAKKDSFKMKLVSFEDGKKFAILKILRKISPNMNLMDSKKLVEELPSTISENLPAADAQKFAAELKEAGATVELS